MSIFKFFKKGDSKSLNQDLFSGGNGSSEFEPVIINAKNSLIGISAEYEFMESKFGKTGSAWELEKQIQHNSNSKNYDIMEIKLSNGTHKKVYFDITSFFGKF